MVAWVGVRVFGLLGGTRFSSYKPGARRVQRKFMATVAANGSLRLLTHRREQTEEDVVERRASKLRRPRGRRLTGRCDLDEINSFPR